MNWTRVALPFIVFFALLAAGRVFPFSFPVLGLPLMFMAAALLTLLLSPVKIDFLETSRETVHQLLPLVGTLTCAGILVQIMTLTGVRGLIAITTVTLPIVVVFLTLFLTLPVSETVLMWGSAPVLGVPLVLLFNTIGLNPIVALAGMSHHLAARRRHPADGHHRPADRGHGGDEGALLRVPQALPGPGRHHRHRRDPDGRLQQEAGLFNGLLVLTSARRGPQADGRR